MWYYKFLLSIPESWFLSETLINDQSWVQIFLYCMLPMAVYWRGRPRRHGTVLLVDFMIKHNFLLENTLVQSIHITLADQPSNRKVIFSIQNKTPVYTHLGKILSGFFFYSHMNFPQLSFTSLWILNPPGDTKITGKDFSSEDKNNKLSKMKLQNERSNMWPTLSTRHIRPK